MYPHTFTPNCKAAVVDHALNVQANADVQVFKPLLGCQFNGPQTRISGYSLPNAAAIVIRGLVLIPAASLVHLGPGPPFWSTPPQPYLMFNDDPNALHWIMHDAFPWKTNVNDELWSFFASTNFLVPLPPPPPPTPVALGATLATATLLTPGVTYIATIPPASQGYGYIPVPTLTGTSTVVIAPTPGSMGTGNFGGSHLGFTFPEGGPFTGPGSNVIPGASHTGPDAIMVASNTLLLVPNTTTFTLT